MKFTLSWLKEHLETEAPLGALVDAMTAVGLEVERVEDPAERLRAFTIGEVLEAEKHPEADKLKVCKVATKDGVLQIVCGAANARKGLKVAYAPVGAHIPGIDLTLTRAKIRGVESFGMMCSAKELELGEDHEGIIEAPREAKVGESVARWLGADDPVIEIETTPNRPDTNGVAGIARDLAAAGMGRLTTMAPTPVTGEFPCPQKIGLHFPPDAANACPIFAGRIVRGVKNGPSPAWLAARLTAIGLRPISALVDITNYLTYDRARPLHVYDADKLKGAIRARLGRDGERFKALDGKTYEVDESMTVIADDRGVLGLGGIIGGEDTGCTEATTNVFIECAYFDPFRTARTGRRTGVQSDARHRFERGVDPEFVAPGLELATRLILDLCGGVASAVEIAGAAPKRDAVVAFPPSEVKRLTGLDVDPARAESILRALGFKVARADPWLVDAPSWRPDIEGKADLVEEIARIIGFDALSPSVLPARAAVETAKPTPLQERRRIVRRALAARGMLEAVTWSFTDERHAALFSEGPNWLAAQGLILANPISSELGAMRPSILPNLIAALQRNADRGRDDLALFEVAPVYASDRPEGQRAVAGGARLSHPRRHWSRSTRPADPFTVKADALAALESVGVKTDQLQTMRDAPRWYHPGRSGALKLGPKKTLAEFGEFHPAVLKEMDVEGPVYGFEVFLDAIPEPKAKATKTKPALEPFELLPVRRDFAFVVDAALPAEALLKAVRAAEKTLISEVALFDVYSGEGIPDGKKSLAVEVTLQPRGKSLTDAEIEAVGSAIIAAVAKETGGSLRT